MDVIRLFPVVAVMVLELEPATALPVILLVLPVIVLAEVPALPMVLTELATVVPMLVIPPRIFTVLPVAEVPRSDVVIPPPALDRLSSWVPAAEPVIDVAPSVTLEVLVALPPVRMALLLSVIDRLP